MSDLVIYDCEQGSREWLMARLGVPSASRFSDVLAKGQGITRKKYLLTLAGEAITGELSEGYTNKHMERGNAMEDEARQAYAFARDVDPTSIGFMRRGRIGASPDSLVGEDGLLEIKTKLPALQLEVLERTTLPPEHKAQVQGQLLVSGRDYVDFVSYWPKLPIFIVRVERDEEYIKTLDQALADFIGELDTYITRYGVQAA